MQIQKRASSIHEQAIFRPARVDIILVSVLTRNTCSIISTAEKATLALTTIVTDDMIGFVWTYWAGENLFNRGHRCLAFLRLFGAKSWIISVTGYKPFCHAVFWPFLPKRYIFTQSNVLRA